jgi:hypothetical protein
MSIAEKLLPEFDQEMATTRRVLERVPDDDLTGSPTRSRSPSRTSRSSCPGCPVGSGRP